MAVTGAGLAYYYQGEKEKKQQQGILVVSRSSLSFPWKHFLCFYHFFLSFAHGIHALPSLSSGPSLLFTPQTTQPWAR